MTVKPKEAPEYDRDTALAAAAIARRYGRDLESTFGTEVAEQIARRIEAMAP